MAGGFNFKNRQVVSSNLKLVLQMSEVMVLHLGGIKWTNFILSAIHPMFLIILEVGL